MSQTSRSALTSDTQYKQAFAVAVIVGIAMNYFGLVWQNNLSFPLPAILVGGGMSLLYLFLGVNESLIYDRLPFKWAAVLFFSIECMLLFAIAWVMGITGTWLMGLPLIGAAVETLSGLWRWPVYVGVVLAINLPVALHTNWVDAFVQSLSLFAAVFFVVIFVQMRLKEQSERERAELLSAQLESANQQLTEYAAQVEKLATTQERHRLARELHDSVTQSLYSLTLLAAGWRRLAAKGQLDNASAHTTAAIETFAAAHRERIELVYLPTYSPHLNHIERLWRLMRSTVTRNRFYESLTAVAEAAVHWLDTLSFARFCSLMGIDERQLAFVTKLFS